MTIYLSYIKGAVILMCITNPMYEIGTLAWIANSIKSIKIE